MTIVVAEDEIITLKAIEQRLKKDGHNVITAQDGREAIRQIEDSSPDLVITGISLPFISGVEIVGAVRSRSGRKVPVIVLSSNGQEKTVLDAFQVGADDYITKPFSPNELSMRVRRYSPEIMSVDDTW